MDTAKQILESRETIKNTLARNLMLARSASDHTQQTLADKSGVSRATIIQIESGEADPRLSTLIDLATTMGINLILFFLGKDELDGLTRLRDEGADEKNQSVLSDEQRKQIEKLLQSGIHKNTIQASMIGAQVAKQEAEKRLGQTRPAMVTGATCGGAIGTVLLPGIGTIMGASIGALLGDRRITPLLESLSDTVKEESPATSPVAQLTKKSFDDLIDLCERMGDHNVTQAKKIVEQLWTGTPANMIEVGGKANQTKIQKIIDTIEIRARKLLEIQSKTEGPR